MRKGLNLIGYARAEMGIGESCRIAANSLTAASVPFGIMNYTNCIQRQQDLSWVSKEMDAPQYVANLIHVNAEMLQNVILYYYKQRLTTNRYNIGYWHWELPEFPVENRHSYQFLHELWVPSFFTLKACAKDATIPIMKIPHSVEVKIIKKLRRTYFHLPEDRFLFLMMYDTQSTNERKNPKGVIEAFKMAFQHSKKAGLVVKVNMGNSAPKDIEYLRTIAMENENIYIIDEIFDRNEVNNLISLCDSYVSLHRSEGFGLPLAEAMYLGKPVIGTNWSGNTDFMKEDNSCLVNYQITKIGKDIGIYKAHNTWADPDLDHAAYYMRKIVEDVSWSKDIAEKGKADMKEKYSPKVVGNMIKQRLEHLKLL